MYKRFIVAIFLFCFLFVLTGCSKSSKTIIDTTIQQVNYNNIYQFAHSGFWIDNKTIYYAQEGLYNRSFYYLDEEGKHAITSTRKLSMSTGDIDGELGSNIQAYGDAIYFCFWGSDNTVSFFRYNKSEKTSEKLFTTDQIVFDWAIYENTVVYTTSMEDWMTLNTVSLWCCDLRTSQPKEIAHKTVAFGIAGGGIRYIQQDENGKAVLYHFDLQEKQSKFLYTFDGVFGEQCFYNFTDDAVVFGVSKLHVLQVKDGKTTTFEVPDAIKFLTCYKEYAFMCSENRLYRIHLATGESALLKDEMSNCNLLHAISDECAVIICYDGESSLLTTSVTAYTVNSDGKAQKILDL